MQLSPLENQRIILFFGLLSSLENSLFIFMQLSHGFYGSNGFHAFVTDIIEEGKVLINIISAFL